MFYPEETVQEVMALNDIITVISGYLALSPRAANHFGICPFHNEKTASFSVNQQRQIFYCFGCHAGGNVLTFVMKMENIDFVGALKILADRVNYKLPEKSETASQKQQRAEREMSAELNKRAARFYHDILQSDSTDAKNARMYLEGRGVSPQIIKRFGLGLSLDSWDELVRHLSDTSPEHIAAAGLATQGKKDAAKYYDRFRSRLMFPIIDSRNRVVGFGGRSLKDFQLSIGAMPKKMDKQSEESKNEAKYVNTPETTLFHKSDNLYGLNLARKTRVSELIIVEGYMDVVSMHQWGFANTVAVLGTALNDSHARLLKNAGCTAVVLMLDGDEAGARATLRAIPILTKGNIKVKTLDISKIDPDCKDPDDFLQKHGAPALGLHIKNAKSHIAFQVELFKKKHDMTTTEGRIAFTEEAAKLLADLSSAIETDAYVAEIAKISDISASAIHAEVSKQKGNPVRTPMVISRRRAQRTVEAPGVKKAKETLLHLILTYNNAAKALQNSGYISEEEIGDEIYIALLNLAYDNAGIGKKSTPAEIISTFETDDAHSKITEIFIDPPEYETRQDVEKSLNANAFTIKKAWISKEREKAKENGDQETLQTLGFMIRNTPAISI